MLDITFPNKNEKEFIKVAEKLNIKELYLIYTFQKEITELKINLKKLQNSTKIKLKFGLIAKNTDILKAKKLSNFVITESSDKDQHIMEKFRPNLIFNFEKDPRKDKTHYRLSGLNQVICKIAKINNITIAYSFSELLNNKKRTILLGRIIQNIRFCKKYKVKTAFYSFAKQPYELRSENSLKSLFRVLEKN